MNRSLRFYDYNNCFTYYAKQIDNIRPKIIAGKRILAKPVLMVALIDGIDAGVFTHNRIVINDWLEEKYKKLLCKYARLTESDNITGIEKPFWHLETDGFWHLQYPGETLGKGSTPSKAWLKANVEYAYFDDDLWLLLQNREQRKKLRDYIIESKLTDDFWSGKIAAEGLGLVLGLIIAA